MTVQRTSDDYAHERAILDMAYAQNEAGRDTFVALAHTALFAASVAFVGDVTPLREAVWRPALILGWICSVAGLLTLTFSFGAARRAIDARRAALNDEEPPASRRLDVLNGISLWSFPASLLCLFSFVTANVVQADEPQAKSAPSAAVSTQHRAPGQRAAASGTELRRSERIGAGRSNTGTQGTHPVAAVSDASTSSTSAEEVIHQKQSDPECC